MNVGELKALIKDMPDEWSVILQRDAEGNGYSPADGGEEGLYLADTDWSGTAYNTHDKVTQMIAEHPCYWSDEDRAPEDAVPALVLWPVN